MLRWNKEDWVKDTKDVTPDQKFITWNNKEEGYQIVVFYPERSRRVYGADEGHFSAVFFDLDSYSALAPAPIATAPSTELLCDAVEIYIEEQAKVELSDTSAILRRMQKEHRSYQELSEQDDD